MRGAVTGSHGFIGAALVRHLAERGDEVVRLVRREAGPGEARWDPDIGSVDTKALEGIDYVVHLAGANIGARPWTPGQRRRIRDSRIRGTDVLSRALTSLERHPRTFISASANGYYGDGGEDELTEDAPAGEGFRASVCVAWEAATRPAEEAGIRVLHLRSGIVLARRGGLFPFLSGWKIAPRLGTGRQFWSWISLQDEVAAIAHLIGDETIGGPVNLTAPHVPRQSEFAARLAKAKRGFVMPVPAWALKTALGPARTREVLLSSERVVPAKLMKSGFAFAHPDLETALAWIYPRRGGA